MKRLCLLLLWIAFPAAHAYAQGCVAARFTPCSPLRPANCTNCMASSQQWLGTVSYRWLHSFRNFTGDDEDPDTAENAVTNDIHSLDLALTYGISARWSATLSLPFLYADRTTRFEHDGVHAHTMHADGIGDIRLLANCWLFDPHTSMDGNLAVGIGGKAPSGDDDAKDTAYRARGAVKRPVDQSIQPGDGGWGLALELQGYQKLHGRLFGYLNGSYTITPEEENGVETPSGDQRGTPAAIKHNSIADQYLGRAGVIYNLSEHEGFSVSLGGRDEGVPVHDAIGGSLGFRRPGYAVSVEPGIAWMQGANAVSVTMPIAVYRTRDRSAAEAQTGLPGGSASFADFLVLASYTRRF